MPRPWEITREEAIAAGQRTRRRLEAADRLAAPLLARQLAESQLPLDWGTRVFSALEDSAKEIWELVFPGVVEGMTWEGALAYQGAAAGPIRKFPASVRLDDESDARVAFNLRNDVWSVTVEGTNVHRAADILFLREDSTVGIVEAVSWERDARPIPQEYLDQSDRFIVVKKLLP